ncbi:MAG: LamG domain-containing protein, partial [Thiohalomonadales bacterium]
MKKIANIKQLASGVSAMNPSTRTGHRVRTESVTRLFQALFFSVAVLSLLNACSEGNDNVTPGSIRGISGDLGEPKVTKGVLTVDQFVATVYNGKDSSNKSTGVLFPRCGGCHNPLSSSKQQPYFADSSAANAYVVATSQSSKGTALFLLSLTTAKDSAVVQKVLSGHNCWSGSSAVSCQNDANELTDRIKDWVNLKNGTGAGSGSGATSIVVKSLAETLAVQVTSESDPQPFKTFPDDIAGGNFTSLHTILKTNCNGCHISSAATPQTPYFADGSEAVSYAALKDNQKIDINVIEKSRIYLRLQNDAHNCWSTCTANAAEVLAAIKVFSDQISVPAALPNGWVTSKALTLGDGQVVSGGVRYEPNIVAKYEFKEGSGTVARDTSGIVPAIDLTLFGNVKWVSGWGVQFLPALPGKGVSRLMSGSVTESRKLLDMIIPNGEFSIEAWVVPANTAQGADAPAVMMSYGVGAASRNLTLGQQLYNYTLATRIDSANADQDIVGSGGANELLATPDADEVLQATLQHVVVTYRGSVDPNDTNAVGRKVYVNGELVFSDPTALGILDDWDEGYLLSLGADSDGSNPFLGRLRLLAIHNAALPADKIRQNFDAGVGKKYHLLFNVGKLDTRMHEQSYILMTIEEFDDFSYKIFDPRFVILGADLAGSPALAETSDVITIKGMRIGINGKEPEVGQVFGKLNEKLSWTATGGVIDIPQVSNILATVQHDFVTG